MYTLQHSDRNMESLDVILMLQNRSLTCARVFQFNLTQVTNTNDNVHIQLASA